MTHIVELIQDPETQEFILPLSPELLESLGWKEGDTIVWEQVGNSFVLKKK